MVKTPIDPRPYPSACGGFATWVPRDPAESLAATRFLRELKNRLKQFSMELHPEKTRLSEFGRLAASARTKAKLGAPETFNFR
jgi:hypothetical protein